MVVNEVVTLPADSTKKLKIEVTQESLIEKGFFKMLSGSSGSLFVRLIKQGILINSLGSALWEDEPCDLDIEMKKEDLLEVELINQNITESIVVRIQLNIIDKELINYGYKKKA